MFALKTQNQARVGLLKPSGIPAIDWSNPLTKNLVYYGFDTAAGIVDLVSGIPALSGTLPGASATPIGAAAKYNGTTQFTYGDMNSTARNAAATAPYSFAAGFVSLAQQTNNASMFMQATSLGNNPFGVYIPNGANRAARMFFADGAGFTDSANGSVTDNVFHVAVGVADTSGHAGGYFDGAGTAGGNFTTTFSPDSTNRNVIGALGQSSNSAFLNGYVYFGAIWSVRVLTGADAFTLYNDPWCFLIWPEDGVMEWVKTTAGGFVPVFRKTLSQIGGRIGTRQAAN